VLSDPGLTGDGFLEELAGWLTKLRKNNIQKRSVVVFVCTVKLREAFIGLCR
jgi:hypothetical protein